MPRDDGILLEHGAWLGALARSLVGDPNVADDVAQEAALAALEHPPRRGSDVRAWLSSVVRNLVRQRHRGEARRNARERTSARREAVDATDDVVARAALRQELMRAVMSLAEPFRTTVLLRFFDELPPRAIAAHLEVPVATVHSRLRRGLERLRARMDDAHGGDRRAWIAAILPAAATQPAGSLAPGLGLVLLGTKAKIATVAVLLTLGTWGVTRLLPGPPAAREGAAPPPVASADEREDAPAVEDLATPATRREGIPGAMRNAPDEAPAETVLLRGLALGAEGAPLPRLALAFAPATGTERALSTDDAGRFALSVSPVPGRVEVAAPEWTTLLAGQFTPGQELEAVVVAAPRETFRGRVEDEAGAPVGGALVEERAPAELSRALDVVLDASRPVRIAARTAEDGSFELDGYVAEGAELVASSAGFLPDRRPAPRTSPADLRIVLRRPANAETTLRGEVLDPSGAPVPAAWVACGERSQQTDTAGAFRFELDPTRPARRLVALKRGHLPGLFEPPEVDGAPHWPAFVELRLGGPPERMAGHVVDEEGEPRAGVRIWVDDARWFGSTGEDPGLVEFLLGDAVRDEELEPRHTDADGELDVESFLAARDRHPTPTWGWVATDESGAFFLPGLELRDYVLAVFDRVTLSREEYGPFPAGSEGLRLVFPGPDGHLELNGCVATPDGEAVVGATVATLRRAIHVVHPDGAATAHDVSGPSTTTDEEGCFELGPLAREGLRLAVRAPGVRSRTVRVADASEPLMLVVEPVEAPPRVHVKLELADPGRADAFVLLDERGVPLALVRSRGTERSSGLRAELVDGRSEVLGVADSAAWIVLYRGDEEAERLAVRLFPGELNLLRL